MNSGSELLRKELPLQFLDTSIIFLCRKWDVWRRT